MADAELTALVERFWSAFLRTETEGAAAVADLVTPDVAFRGSLGIAVHGPDGIADYCHQALGVFKGFHVAVEEVLSAGDRAAARLAFTGVHQAPLFGIAPTGKELHYGGTAWMTLEGERFKDIRVMGDAAEWLLFFRGLQR
jgi:predicted ester cyclase